MPEYKLMGNTYQIRQDPTTNRPKFYCVMQNPFKTTYDTVVLYATSVNALMNKISKQYKKYEKEKEGK